MNSFMEVGIWIFLAVVFLMAGYGFIVSRKYRDKREVFLKSDGVEYRRLGSPTIRLRWNEIKTISYNWGPWYEDVFGVFPIREWCFFTNDGKWLRIDDKDANASILMPALKKKFPEFRGDRETLKVLAQREEFVDGTFHCWPADV